MVQSPKGSSISRERRERGERGGRGKEDGWQKEKMLRNREKEEDRREGGNSLEGVSCHLT